VTLLSALGPECWSEHSRL